MKTSLVALLVVSFGFFSAGCGHLDTSSLGAADRVLTGYITNNTGGGELPANSEVWIRILDLSQGLDKGEVLGEETIMNPGRMPVNFRIEYRAEDAVLMRSVTVDARISVDGRLRYMTKTAHPITLGNVNDTHVVQVDVAGKQ